MSKIKYFAYGSNMGELRLVTRVPSAKKIGVAKLEKYQLKFNKKSIDDSGKANAHYTGDINDFIWGVIFEIDEEEKSSLDKLEQGYTPENIIIDGCNEDVYLYIADKEKIDDSLKPYDWYLFHLIFGAVFNKIDADYTKRIVEQQTIESRNPERYKKGLDECIKTYTNKSIPSELDSNFSKLKKSR